MRCQGVPRSIVGLVVAMGVSGTLGSGVIQGPRMQVAGQSINQRASRPYVAQSPT